MADGTVELNVVECREEVVTEVVRGGVVRSRSGISVPSERLSLPALSEKDEADLERAIELGADVVAQSFVRGAADVAQLRRLIGDRPLAVLAKVETRAGLEQVEGILEEADEILVGRGDLGTEVPLEEIPLIQKDLIRRARAVGKPAIVATEMLQSMTGSWRPTRAEATSPTRCSTGLRASCSRPRRRSAATPPRRRARRCGSSRPPSGLSARGRRGWTPGRGGARPRSTRGGWHDQ